MVIAAREARVFASERGRADLDRDRMFARALTHAILEIGEAAANVSDQSRARVPGLPWDEIVRMRNVLIHIYWGVSLDKLWEAVERDVSSLIAALDNALAKWPLVLD